MEELQEALINKMHEAAAEQEYEIKKRQRTKEIIENINVDSIVDSLKNALLGALSAINDIIPALKENIEKGELDEVAKKVVIEKLVDCIEKEND